MALNEGQRPSVAERVRRVDAGATIVAAAFSGPSAIFALGEEAVLLATSDGETRRVSVHAGAILSAASDGRRLLTGGDDGKVVSTDGAGASETIATDARHRWIDRVACGP